MGKGKKLPEVFFPVEKNSNELSLYHYGRHDCLPTSEYGPAKRDYYLLHFIADGKGTYTVKGKTFHLEKNEIFLIRPNEETFYRADEEEPWEYYFVAFHGIHAEKMVRAVDWIDGYIARPKNHQFVKSIMRSIYAVKKPAVWGEYMVLGNLYMLLANLVKETENEVVFAGTLLVMGGADHCHQNTQNNTDNEGKCGDHQSVTDTLQILQPAIAVNKGLEELYIEILPKGQIHAGFQKLFPLQIYFHRRTPFKRKCLKSQRKRAAQAVLFRGK